MASTAGMDGWPELSAERDGATFAVLHLASQMLGKLRVAHAPWANHGWHATLHPQPYGLAIAPIISGARSFTLALDLCQHAIALRVSDGSGDLLPLAVPTIADLHSALIEMLDRHGLPSGFHGRPNEIEGAPLFADDRAPCEYHEGSARRLLQALTSMLPVFDRFRAGFSGKASPVHFFWGSFDLAVTRFSGRPAPQHPGGIPGLPDRITREAYSHEVSSAGFWPGGVTAADPIFYSYAYPEPPGYRSNRIRPNEARFDEGLGEFVLSYEDVRRHSDPARALADFLQSTYVAAADCAGWDRHALEREVAAP